VSLFFITWCTPKTTCIWRLGGMGPSPQMTGPFSMGSWQHRSKRTVSGALGVLLMSLAKTPSSAVALKASKLQLLIAEIHFSRMRVRCCSRSVGLSVVWPAAGGGPLRFRGGHRCRDAGTTPHSASKPPDAICLDGVERQPLCCRCAGTRGAVLRRRIGREISPLRRRMP
jgi:hypothetical protein